MMATMMERPSVRGTKMKWNMVAMANWSLDNMSTSIVSLL
jgi:hypothetical protein